MCELFLQTMSAANQNSRLKSYKNKGLDAEELRRRREEEGVQIRKAKREEQVRILNCINICCGISSYVCGVKNSILKPTFSFSVRGLNILSLFAGV